MRFFFHFHEHHLLSVEKCQVLFSCFGNLFHFPSLHENPNLSGCRICSSCPNIQKAGAEPHPSPQAPTAVCLWAIHCSRESTNWQLCQTALTQRRTGSEWVATRTIYPFSHKIPASVEVCYPLTNWIFFLYFLLIVKSCCPGWACLSKNWFAVNKAINTFNNPSYLPSLGFLWMLYVFFEDVGPCSPYSWERLGKAEERFPNMGNGLI